MARSAAGHPLLATDPVSVMSWDTWRRQWEEASYYEEYVSLLRLGFGLGIDNRMHFAEGEEDAGLLERLRFYLDCADGFTRSNEFWIEPDEGLIYSPVNMKRAKRRIAIAQVAFNMLCKNVFDPSRQYPYTGTKPLLNQSAAWEAILEFFRFDYERRTLNNYVPDTGNRNFNVVQELFRGISDTAAWKQLGLRPQIIETLFGLGLVELLEDSRVYPFDDSCWRTLERLAFLPQRVQSARMDFTDEVPATVQQAYRRGSMAAKVLILRRTKEDQGAEPAWLREGPLADWLHQVKSTVREEHLPRLMVAGIPYGHLIQMLTRLETEIHKASRLGDRRQYDVLIAARNYLALVMSRITT